VKKWKLVLCNTDGTQIGSLTAATSRKLTWVLDDAASASFTIPGTHKQAQGIVEASTDLVAYDRNGQKRFRGRIGPSGDDISSAGHVSTFSATDYRGLVGRRIIWPGSTLVFTTEEQVSIAWQLIADTQATTGGDLGITVGTSLTTSTPRSETYQEGALIGDTLKTLGDLAGGFDWEVDPDLKFNTFFPERGIDPGVTLSYPVQLSKVQRTVDTTLFGNAIRQSGDSTILPATAVGAIGAAGRWELQFGDTLILDEPTLTARATWQLAQSIEIDPSYVLTMKPGVWTPELLWLGDTMTLVVKSGRLDVNADFRVSQIEVALGDDGGETVTITVGPVIRNPNARLRLALQRLSKLETR